MFTAPLLVTLAAAISHAVPVSPAPPALPAAKGGTGPSRPSADSTTAGAAAGTSAAVPATGMVTIESDLQQADNRTGIVTATGNVKIVYPERSLVATARQAQYFSREGKLVLSGDVDVVDADGQRIRAERVIYRLDSERVVAEPVAGRQVVSKFRLQPLQAQGATPAAPARPGNPAKSPTP